MTHKDMANAVRLLSADAVQQAKSGHPGMPMGMADVATVLVSRFLKFEAQSPRWPDRDRLVLSAGHGSMLLYSLMYLTGYEDMTLDQVKNFRQLGSITAGHPEFGHASGVETTTGPLGQGLANAVGMALTEKMLQVRYGPDLVDHYTYVIAGDGCLMEGISHEAISLAGHLRLSKLIVLFDDNNISIDGPTDLTVSDDQISRFIASGWHTASVDGHDPEAVATAIEVARGMDKPSFIACSTIIGFGAPTLAGTAKTHGAPLGIEEIARTRDSLGWPFKPFEIPQGVLAAWRKVGSLGSSQRAAWNTRLAAVDASQRTEFVRTLAGDLPDGWQTNLDAFKKKAADEAPIVATRKASQMVLEVLSQSIPELVGGSADLTGSNYTKMDDMLPITAADASGRYIYYGVREHAMAAVMNGIALHGGLIPYGGTFLVFTDYCRPAIRLSALMGQRVIYVMTHDSIGLGEDGPTHQPIEHLASLRAIPNILVMRPCDLVETVECWKLALAQEGRPSILALSRQGVPTLRTKHSAENFSARGGYVVSEALGARQATLIGTGSELCIAMDAQARLKAEGISVAVVSLPCWELFEEQSSDYRKKVLGSSGVRIAVEAASMFGWERYIGADGLFIGMRSFGASAPAGDLYQHFGITEDAIVNAVRARV